MAILALRALTSSCLLRARWNSSSEHHQNIIIYIIRNSLLTPPNQGSRDCSESNKQKFIFASIALGANLEQKGKHKLGNWLEQISLRENVSAKLMVIQFL